ncbi:MAG: hypothetical protein JXB10_08080 [Pirellulales bacterium]|nr:hypothetical protein [Pirellulales bacterium]
MYIKRNDKQRLILVDFPFMVAVVGQLPAAALLCLAVAGKLQPSQEPGADTYWLGLLFFILFAVGWDAVMLWFAKLSTFDFDLVHRQLYWRRRSVYRKKSGIIPFDQIRGASVDILPSGSGSSYRLVLSTVQGTVPVMDYYTGGGRSDAKEYERIAAVVNAALKTHPAAEMEDQILELLAGGHRLAAIQMAMQRYGYDLNQASQFVDSLTQR